MAAIKVKASKPDGTDQIIFSAEGAGLAGDLPTQGIVKSDGKVVVLEGRHMAVKQALRDGLIVEVKGGQKVAE